MTYTASQPVACMTPMKTDYLRIVEEGFLPAIKSAEVCSEMMQVFLRECGGDFTDWENSQEGVGCSAACATYSIEAEASIEDLFRSVHIEQDQTLDPGRIVQYCARNKSLIELAKVTYFLCQDSLVIITNEFKAARLPLNKGVLDQAIKIQRPGFSDEGKEILIDDDIHIVVRT